MKINTQRTAIPLISGVVGFCLGAIIIHYKNKDEIEELNYIIDANELNRRVERVNELDKRAKEDNDNYDNPQLQLDLDLLHSNSYARIPNNIMEDEVSVVIPPEEPNDIVVENQPNSFTIFNNRKSNWDFELESENRSFDAPYVLHQDEYFSSETNFSQTTLTYYCGDDILVDEQEVPIYNFKVVIGELKFGHGCDDINVFYVRNHSLHGEYEILKDSGSYEIEVLGNEYAAILSRLDQKAARVEKFRDE